MTAFDRALNWDEEAPGLYRGSVDDSWVQGRGVFGGMVLALFERAFVRTLGRKGEARSLRSLTCNFCAPMGHGPSCLDISVLREGRSVSFVAGILHGEPGVVAHATAVFAADRKVSFDWSDDPPPHVLRVEESSPLPADVPGLPQFAKHVEYRYAVGGVPFSGDERALVGGWSRLKEERAVDVPWVLATLDAWPPPGFVRLDRPVGAATLCMTCELTPLAGQLVGEGHRYTLFSSETSLAAGGYAHEVARLWTEDGRPLARATQVRALLG